MCLDDYLEEINLSDEDQVRNAIKRYHKEKQVYLFNTYDFFDYLINLSEKASVNRKEKLTYNFVVSLEQEYEIFLEFGFIVNGLSKDTYVECDEKLLNELILDYCKRKNH